MAFFYFLIALLIGAFLLSLMGTLLGGLLNALGFSQSRELEKATRSHRLGGSK
jgi:hypothetical protein